VSRYAHEFECHNNSKGKNAKLARVVFLAFQTTNAFVCTACHRRDYYKFNEILNATLCPNMPEIPSSSYPLFPPSLCEQI
jgi:hypothetical protein